MKTAIEDRDGQVHIELRPGSGVYRLALTEHDANDLEAALAQHKAKGRYCDTETGEHTCVMPPGHSVLPHACRACPETWRT